MSIQLNHTIVAARDKSAAAQFYSQLLGLPEPQPFGPFMVVELQNAVSLDFVDAGPEITTQHYAFLVGETEFDEILGRIRARGLTYWADPGHHQPHSINHRDGGRGVYWSDPDGHNLEILTRPYGG
ncbi:MAG: VOC family protein [Actinomycetota bacterium]|nr:MAG: VOC family protein [Actinomycetota bacterium]